MWNITEKTRFTGLGTMKKEHIVACLHQQNHKVNYVYFGARSSKGTCTITTKNGQAIVKFIEKNGFATDVEIVMM